MRKTCPRCGSSHVRIVPDNESPFVVNRLNIAVAVMNIFTGIFVFLVYDWWMAIVKKIRGEKHVWKCTVLMANRNGTGECLTCGYIFKA